MTTHYGVEVTRKLAYQLAYLGVTVVSGGGTSAFSANNSWDIPFAVLCFLTTAANALVMSGFPIHASVNGGLD
jgi:hypothetical protein